MTCADATVILLLYLAPIFLGMCLAWLLPWRPLGRPVVRAHSSATLGESVVVVPAGFLLAGCLVLAERLRPLIEWVQAGCEWTRRRLKRG